MSSPLLRLEDVTASYGEGPVLRGLSLEIKRGMAASLIGRNGAGKTTTLRSIMGVIRPTSGSIVYDGTDITAAPVHRIANLGIGYVPEDRQVFPDLTVEENLRMGGIGADGGTYTMDDIYRLFPRLQERIDNKGSQLSGGEQQMLVIARTLLRDVDLILLDEPTEGLAPAIVDDVIDVIEKIKDAGVTVLVVEQNLQTAFLTSDDHYVIGRGEIVYHGTTAELRDANEVLERHLGINA